MDTTADPEASGEGRLGESPLDESKFTFNGYLQLQSGIFFSPDVNKFDAEGVPTDHGDKLGKLSMLRATLQLEADWRPFKRVSLHVILRGVRSLRLDADKDAQVPEPGYFGQPEKTIDWVQDNYYNEISIRELYLDIDATSWLSFRAGRQQVSWGETGQYRLLDVVNPIDSTWHFGPLESFEDQRIPLWMLKTQVDIRALRGNLELVWIPLLDPPDRMVSIPLTFVGAWGLPPPPKQGNDAVAPEKIYEKIFEYPKNDIDNSRLGARWRGEIGNFTYSLVYFYTQLYSPPIPIYYIQPYGGGGEGLIVHLDFPRQHIVGLSLETNLPYPIGTNIKFEAALEPDRTYPTHSLVRKRQDPPEPIPGRDVINYFETRKKAVLNYALTLQQPVLASWLNREQAVWFVLQFMHSAILNFGEPNKDAVIEGGCGECVPSDDIILDVPGYDSTLSKRHTFRVIAAAFTSYLHGILTPRIVGAWIPMREGFVSLQLGVVLGNSWRLNLAVNQFFGSDPYSGIGFFRDRDEVNLLVRYQF